MWTCKLVSYISWKICIFQRIVRLALIGRTFRKLQSETDWWRPVHSVWAHSNAGDDVSHSSCEIFFPSKSWDIEAVGCCCAGPIIILFQLVDSVSRFLSEKLQNNKIQLRKSFFFHARSFVHHRDPLCCSFGNLWEALQTFIFYLWWTYHFCRRDQRRIGSLGTRQTAPVCHLSIRCACGLPFEKVCPKLQR